MESTLFPSSSRTAFLPHLSTTRTGFLHLQQQRSPSSLIQFKSKIFSTLERIVVVDTHSSRSFHLPPDESFWKGVFERDSKKRENLRKEISMMRNRFGVVPGLATIPFGNIKESETYLTMKETCEIVGVKLYEAPLPDDDESIDEEQVLECVNRFREDPCVHNILIPFPLPQHMDEEKILDAIHYDKIAGGFHQPITYELMRAPYPSTGVDINKCIGVLKREINFDIKGKRAVLVSNFDVTPDWLLLMRECTSVSKIGRAEINNYENIIKEADILIVPGAEQTRVGSLMKSGAVMLNSDIKSDPPEPSTVDNLLYNTYVYADKQEFRRSKSKK